MASVRTISSMKVRGWGTPRRWGLSPQPSTPVRGYRKFVAVLAGRDLSWHRQAGVAGTSVRRKTLGRFFDDLGAERAATLTHVSARVSASCREQSPSRNISGAATDI